VNVSPRFCNLGKLIWKIRLLHGMYWSQNFLFNYCKSTRYFVSHLFSIKLWKIYLKICGDMRQIYFFVIARFSLSCTIDQLLSLCLFAKRVRSNIVKTNLCFIFFNTRWKKLMSLSFLTQIFNFDLVQTLIVFLLLFYLRKPIFSFFKNLRGGLYLLSLIRSLLVFLMLILLIYHANHLIGHIL